MSGPRPGVRGWWDRILASRHRRSILGSLAVLALLVVVLVVGLFQGDPNARGDASGTAPATATGVSRLSLDTASVPAPLRAVSTSVDIAPAAAPLRAVSTSVA